MEKYNGWIIDEDVVSRSDSKVVLRASIYPNLEELYSILKAKKVVDTPFDFLTDYHLWKSFNGNIPAILSQIKDPTQRVHFFYRLNDFADRYKYGLGNKNSQRDYNLYLALAKLRSQHQYSTTQQSSALLMIGDYFLRERAMKKIKEYIDKNLPRIQPEMLSRLKEQNLIPSWITVF